MRATIRPNAGNTARGIGDTPSMTFRGMLALAVLVAAVSGCSAAQSPAAPQPFDVPTAAATEASPPPSTAATPDVVLTPAEEEIFGPRVVLPDGLVLKQLGKVAQWGGPDDALSETWGARLVVDSIEVDPGCDEYAPDPARGHLVELTVRVETSAEYDAISDGVPTSFEWSTVGPDGVTEAAAGYTGCHSSTELPFEMRPSAKYRGTIAIDTANTSGRAVLADFAAWDYPTA